MYQCSECKNECKMIKEEFDYSGSHCTHGEGGTHFTGHYISDCCLADVDDVFAPSRDGSKLCKSGSVASGGNRTYCTCDICF